MRNVDWIVIAPTVAYVLLAAFALWSGSGTKVVESRLRSDTRRYARTADEMSQYELFRSGPEAPPTTGSEV
jgi:hypothetical protein